MPTHPPAPPTPQGVSIQQPKGSCSETGQRSLLPCNAEAAQLAQVNAQGPPNGCSIGSPLFDLATCYQRTLCSTRLPPSCSALALLIVDPSLLKAFAPAAPQHHTNSPWPLVPVCEHHLSAAFPDCVTSSPNLGSPICIPLSYLLLPTELISSQQERCSICCVRFCLPTRACVL